jgi:hypothetical protein
MTVAGGTSSPAFAITDALGRILRRFTAIETVGDNDAISVDVSGLLPGTYYLLTTGGGPLRAKPFIVR